MSNHVVLSATRRPSSRALLKASTSHRPQIPALTPKTQAARRHRHGQSPQIGHNQYDLKARVRQPQFFKQACHHPEPTQYKWQSGTVHRASPCQQGQKPVSSRNFIPYRDTFVQLEKSLRSAIVLHSTRALSGTSEKTPWLLSRDVITPCRREVSRGS